MTLSEKVILGVGAALLGKYLWDHHRPLVEQVAAHAVLETALTQMRPEIAAFVRDEVRQLSVERQRLPW